MRSKRMRVLVTGVAALTIGIYAEIGFSGEKDVPKNDPLNMAVEKGLKWLVSVQGKDGGWGQDGGETSYVRQGENLESKGNDVANSAVVVEALLHAGNSPTRGEYREPLQRAVNFILKNIERSPADGLAVTDLTGTQIQRKLGPYIDTFLTSKLLAELDGTMGDAQSNARVRQSLQKCVAKIEKNQLKDGSWNIAGGWAPILGTSMASQSLFIAQGKGVAVQDGAMNRIEQYTKLTSAAPGAGGGGGGSAGGVVGGVIASRTDGTHLGVPSATGSFGGGIGSGKASGATASTVMVEASVASAGVPLYKRAQELEQLSRTDKDRKANAPQIKAIKEQLSDARFMTGFGSIGGEEFFSYLNIGDSLHRTGGPEWDEWNAGMKAKILKIQNEDGTWAGHHCITGRVAVTSAAILLLLADREQVVQTTSLRKN
jgi:hypothetical protein